MILLLIDHFEFIYRNEEKLTCGSGTCLSYRTDHIVWENGLSHQSGNIDAACLLSLINLGLQHYFVGWRVCGCGTIDSMFGISWCYPFGVVNDQG
jgi:hypothetical protein